MKSAVVVFPASNCDRDAAVALEPVIIRRATRICAAAFVGMTLPTLAGSADNFRIREKAAKEALAAHNISRHLDTDFSFIAETYVRRMHELHPEISGERLEALHALILQELAKHRDEYLRTQIRTYAKHYTREELDAAKEFYKSRLGQRMETENDSIISELGTALNNIEHAAIHDATIKFNSRKTGNE